MKCPCCSGLLYANCCQPYHKMEKFAPSAEALMRSRYSAFAIPNAEYLMETTLPSKRKFHNKTDLQEWGEINQWMKLEIVASPSPNRVVFKAYYTDKNIHSMVHYESSEFKIYDNRWYYVGGKFLDEE